ncbi:MAG TPA: hypothetical protein VL326_18780 [Kofleriaceae bacterium]|nr:hypothetical protein [Kofleriaceae bacterium]
MGRVAIAAVLAVTACGRLSFDPVTTGDGGPTGDGDGGDVPRSSVAYLKASNADPGDEFGESLAMSRDGTTIAVGAPLEASGTRAINGDGANNSAPDAGAVYVFRRSGDSWTQEAYIKASNADPADQFGWSVALSGDGNLLVVGARGEDSIALSQPTNNAATDAGAAYVYARSGSTWTEQGYLKANTLTAGDKFGERVAISDDGTTVAVGTPLEDSGATTINGNGLDDTFTDAGAVYVFAYVGNQWSQVSYIKPSNTDAGDWFGWRVALSATGDMLAVSAYREDSNASGVDGNLADDSVTNTGAVYLFTRAGMTWSPGSYIKASNPNLGDDFGYGLALSSDGTTLVGAAEGEASGSTTDQADNSRPSSGAAYVFRSGPWSQSRYLKATNPGAMDELGYGLATSSNGDIVIVGAPFEASNATGWDGDGANDSAMDAGAAYLYLLEPVPETHYIKAAQTTAGDQFGWACAMSGTGSVVAVSMPFEDGSGRGINLPVDEATPDSGAVYVYY